MGADGKKLIFLISRQFAYLVLISIVLGCPAAGILLNKWLQSFAYRDELHWWIYALAALLALMLALISVIYQAVKVSRTNPADSLRYE